MFRRMMSSVLFAGLMAISATSNATLLVNHHNQPYREYKRHVTDHRAFPKASKHQARRSYTQHAKFVDHCVSMKDGRHHRVC